METLEQAAGLDVEVSVHAEQPERKPAPAVIEQIPAPPPTRSRPPPNPPRTREVGVEISSMIGHRVIGWMCDSATGSTLFTINGTLTGLKPSDGQLILVIDGNTDTAPLLPLEGITAGDVWEGNVDVRFGAIEFRLYRVPGKGERTAAV